MKAAVFHEAKAPLVVEALAIAKPKRNEVLIRVAASGLCHSDYHFISGDMPFVGPAVFGHEAAGIVEQIGEDVAGFAIGDHVVACGSAFCGHCPGCVTGHTHRCSDRPGRQPGDGPTLTLSGAPVVQFMGLGAFAEQMLVHHHAIVKVPRELPLDRAALLSCGVLTGLGTVFNSARVQPGSTVVIIGCGGVGLNVVQGARIAGASRIIAVDRSPEKLDLARSFGATDGVVAGPDVVDHVRTLTGGAGADYAFEVIGLPATIEQGLLMLAPGGLLTTVGAMPRSASFAIPGMLMVLNEWRVQGALLGSGPFTVDIPRYAELYRRGLLDLDRLISERIALGDINRGFDNMLGGTQARNVIVFDEVLADAARAG